MNLSGPILSPPVRFSVLDQCFMRLGDPGARGKWGCEPITIPAVFTHATALATRTVIFFHGVLFIFLAFTGLWLITWRYLLVRIFSEHWEYLNIVQFSLLNYNIFWSYKVNEKKFQLDLLKCSHLFLRKKDHNLGNNFTCAYSPSSDSDH